MSIQAKTVDVVIDDLTGAELSGRAGGWELRGLAGGATYHFKSLGGLLAALATQAKTFGLGDNEALLRWTEYDYGKRIKVEDVPAGDGRTLAGYFSG